MGLVLAPGESSCHLLALPFSLSLENPIQWVLFYSFPSSQDFPRLISLDPLCTVALKQEGSQANTYTVR